MNIGTDTRDTGARPLVALRNTMYCKEEAGDDDRALHSLIGRNLRL